MPSAGELRDSIRFERRGSQGNVGGVVKVDWVTIVDRCPAKLLPTRGREEIVAGRLTGVSSWDCWVRSNSQTRQVRTGDRAVDRRDPSRVFNVRFIGDMDGRRTWLLMQLELGAPT